MRLSILGILLASFVVQAAESLPIIGHPCEGCEAAFDGLPSAVSTRLQAIIASNATAAADIVGTTGSHSHLRNVVPPTAGAIDVRGWLRQNLHDARAHEFYGVSP